MLGKETKATKTSSPDTMQRSSPATPGVPNLQAQVSQRADGPDGRTVLIIGLQLGLRA